MFTNRNQIEVNGMKKACISVVKRLYKEQQGQALWFALLSMMTMLGMGGFMIDLGRFYVVRSQLQLSTNAAGLAAAGSIWDSQTTDNAKTVATNYIANNPLFGLPEANINGTQFPIVQTTCLNSLLTSPQTCSNTGNIQNAIKIVEAVAMPTTFMSLFGKKTLIAEAEATASMQGQAQGWNIAVIVDATGSMADTNTTDSACSGDTNMQCALHGVQTLLGSLNPCVIVTNCTNATASVHVALFTFPNVLTSALTNFYTGCSGTGTPNGAPNTANPTTMWYAPLTLPIPGATSYTPLTYQQANLTSTNSNPAWTATGTNSWTASYEVTYPETGTAAASDADANGFVSDYYDAGDSTTGDLNTSSSLIKAIGYTGTSTHFGCMPIAPNGIDLGSGTNVGSTELHDSVATGSTSRNGQWTGGGTQESTSAPVTVINAMGVGHGITFFAPAIYAAQAALTAEQALNVSNGMPAGSNAIILLSDGGFGPAQWEYFPQGQSMPPEASACATIVATPTAACMFSYVTDTSANAATTSAATISSSQSTLGYSTLNTTPNYTGNVYEAYKPTSDTGAGSWLADLTSSSTAGSKTGTYPDFVDQCQQSIAAGNYATAQGTRVYAVAYQSGTNGCNMYSGNNGAQDYSDVTLVATGTYNSGTYSSVSSVNPCNVMENIASDLSYFFSDSGSSCTSPNWPDVTTLAGIFGQLGSTFSSPRLLPNGMT